MIRNAYIKIAGVLAVVSTSLVASTAETTSKLAIWSKQEGLAMHVWADESMINFAPGHKDATISQLTPQLTINFVEEIKFGWTNKTEFLVCKPGWSVEHSEQERRVTISDTSVTVRIFTTDALVVCEGSNFQSYSRVEQTD